MGCRHIGVGPRVMGLIESLRKGAGKVEVDYDYSGNFSVPEMQTLERYHDGHFQTRSQSAVHPRHVHIGNARGSIPAALGLFNPFVKGLMNPVAQLLALDRVHDPKVEKVCIDVTNIYNRGHEPAEVTEKLFEMVDAFLEQRPVGRRGRMEFL